MKIKERKELLLGLGGVLWLLAVLLGYAYSHKPFTPSQAVLLVKEFWQILVAASVLSLAGGLGHKLFPPRENWNPLVALAVQGALGAGILGLLIFLLGVSVGFSGTIFIVFFLIGGFLVLKDMLAWWRQWAAFSIIWQKSSHFEKILAFGILFLLFTTFLKSLAPPLAFDSLVYHLALPKIYLLEGRMLYVPELIFWGMPQQAEMLYTFAMALGGAEAAILLSWALGALTLAGLLGYLSERFSTRAAWVALVSLLAGQTLSDSLSWAYVEWIVMLYGFCVFVLLDMWTASRERKLLWMAALLVGFAIGTKYTAGILLVAALPIIFLANHGRGVKSTLRDILIFIGIATLAVSPWLIKNILATGNPVYPLLFPAGEMNIHRLHLYQSDPPWGDWRDLLFLPWRATVWGLDGKVGYSAEIGSLLLAFSGLAWLDWMKYSERQKRTLQTAFLITLTGFLLWAFAGCTSRLLIQSRLYFVIFPAWAVLAGIGFEGFSRLRGAGVRFGRIAAVFVLLSFGFNLFQSSVNFAFLDVTRILLGVQTPASYREQALGKYETAMASIEKLPSDSHVLMLWETRGFACVPQCEPDEVIDRWYADLRTYGSSEAVLDAWRAAGYTHLLYNKRGADFIREDDLAYSASDWDSLAIALGQLDMLVDFENEYQLFSLSE
ncbi:MAG: hypothetical protein HN975_01365 [Anaerolineae bacterium]|jgi:hypothetical protein|nr:hypothetical protein [Anaerolineae bacterium]MBT7989992.1 hypothetical protein [Anaerolineae bacterium]